MAPHGFLFTGCQHLAQTQVFVFVLRRWKIAPTKNSFTASRLECSQLKTLRSCVCLDARLDIISISWSTGGSDNR